MIQQQNQSRGGWRQKDFDPREMFYQKICLNLRSSVVGGFIDWFRSFSTLLRASLTVSIWLFMLLKNFLLPSSPSSPLRPSAAVWKTLYYPITALSIGPRSSHHLLESWRSWLSSWRLCWMSAALEESPIFFAIPWVTKVKESRAQRMSEVEIFQKWTWWGSRRFNSIMLRMQMRLGFSYRASVYKSCVTPNNNHKTHSCS